MLRVRLGGRLVQGCADAVAQFYKDAENKPDSKLVIVNVAKRVGQPRIQSLASGNRIYWLPMSEQNRVAKCQEYMKLYGDQLQQLLQAGCTIVVNCQEGVHRSVEFAKQFEALVSATPTPAVATVTAAAAAAAAAAGTHYRTPAQYVYHKKQITFKGSEIMPLNVLKRRHPELYTRSVSKYQGREFLLNCTIPVLNCLWNDVVHTSTVHPHAVYLALQEAGCKPQSDTAFFEIPITALSGMEVAWLPYTASKRPQQQQQQQPGDEVDEKKDEPHENPGGFGASPPQKRQGDSESANLGIGAGSGQSVPRDERFIARSFHVERFDPHVYQLQHTVPALTMEYYKQCARDGTDPRVYHHIPHVLIKGTLNTAHLRVIPWNLPPGGANTNTSATSK